MLYVGLIGAGAHSTTHHAPSLHRFAREYPGMIELSVVCDLDAVKAERARETFGFRRSFTRVEDVFDCSQIDAAVIVLPTPAMLPMINLFLAQRIPIVIEKPLGINLDEARSIVTAVQAAETQVMVSMNRRFDPGLRLALKWIHLYLLLNYN